MAINFTFDVLSHLLDHPLARKAIDRASLFMCVGVCLYNFCRVHQTMRVTPAMEAGISAHVWTVEELAALLDSN